MASEMVGGMAPFNIKMKVNFSAFNFVHTLVFHAGGVDPAGAGVS